MTNPIDKTHDYVNELERENKVLEEYISNQQKKIDGWKESWELLLLEQEPGVLERNLKNLRELQGLEIGEWEEWEERIRKILEDMPEPPVKFPVMAMINDWIDGYTAWCKRMTEHFADE